MLAERAERRRERLAQERIEDQALRTLARCAEYRQPRSPRKAGARKPGPKVKKVPLAKQAFLALREAQKTRPALRKMSRALACLTRFYRERGYTDLPASWR